MADIGAIIFGVLCVYRACTGQKAMIWRVDLSLFLIFAFFGLMLLSVVPPLVSGSRMQMMQYLKSSTHFSYMWFFTVCCAAMPVDTRIILRAIRGYVYAAIPVSLFGIYQVPARAFDLPFAWIKMTNVSIGSDEQLSLGYEGFFRATSFFSEPSTLAFFTSFAAVFLLIPYLVYDVRIIRSRFLFYLSMYSTFTAMFLTFSLTIVAQLSAFIFVLMLISRGSNYRKLVRIIVTMSTVFYLANSAVSFYSSTDVFDLYFRRIVANLFKTSKVETTMGDSFETRATDQRAAYSIWKKAPFLGTGFGCLMYVKAGDGERYISTHQTYLYALATTGFAGGIIMFVLMLTLSISAFQVFFRYRRTHTDVDASLIVIAIAPFAAANQFVFGLSSDNLTVSYSWIMIGLVCSILYNPEYRKLHSFPTFRFFVPQQLFGLRPIRAALPSPLQGEL